MLDGIKSLVIVLALSLTVFALARPICLKFMTDADFTRRRNVWIVLTSSAFLAPTIWIFAGIAVPVIYWAGSVDRHPSALYLMLLLTAPFARVPIPLPLVNQLFELTPYRILALALLVPAALRIMRRGDSERRGLVKADFFVLAFGLLQLVVNFPYTSITNTARNAVLYLIDTYVLYYVFSRATAERVAFRDTLACLWLCCAVLVPVVIFEGAKSWLLYPNVPIRWGNLEIQSYITRDGILRAQGPAGHSLTMGILLATAFGTWLYLGGYQSKRVRWVVDAAIWAGLIATYSRGPWLVAAVVFAFYTLLSPAGRRHIVGTSVLVALTTAALSLTTFGARLIDLLPFIGTKEQGNVDYRQQLAEVSWRLIKQNPFFGDIFAARYMEELRQGQGIIDLVNTYASMAVFYGLVGATLFVLCFAYPAFRSLVETITSWHENEDNSNLGAVVVSCMVGVLIMMATTSFIGAFEQLAWVIAGLCSAYPALVTARSGLDPATPRGAVLAEAISSSRRHVAR